MTEFTKLTPSYQGGEFAKPEHVIEVQEAFAPIESELADHEERVTAAEGALADTSVLLPDGRQIMQYPERLSRWRTRRDDARFAPAPIVCVGDSITEGAYSNDAAAVDSAAVAIWRTRGWVGQIRSLFADRYGDPGEGFLFPPLSGVYGSFTNSAAVIGNSANLGGFGHYITLPSSTSTFTCVLPKCTGFRVHAWWVQGTSGQIRYTVDGGSQQTASASSGSDTLYFFDVTGLSDTTHTLVFTGPSSGSAAIIGVEARYEAVAGLPVHRIGLSGMMLRDFSSTFDTVSSGGNRQLDSGTKIFDPALVIIAMSVNNVTRGWSTYAYTPAQIQAGFGRVLDHIVSNGSDVLVVCGPWRDPASYSIPYTQVQYDDAIKAAITGRDHVALIDLKDSWASYSNGNALGLYWDTVHPRRRGHANMARLIYDAIGGN